MGAIRLLASPVRRIASSRLFQLAAVVAIILLLDHYAYDYAALRSVAESLKIWSPHLCSSARTFSGSAC